MFMGQRIVRVNGYKYMDDDDINKINKLQIIHIVLIFTKH